MSSKPRTRVNLAQIATQLADRRELWQPLVRYDALSRYYVRLASSPDYEAWLLTWLPGQRTDWHDHGGSAGAFLTVAGALTERHATVEPDGALRVLTEPRALATGALRAFGTRHVHQVANNALEPATSVHVYSPALVEMNTYREHDAELHQISSQLVGLNW